METTEVTTQTKWTLDPAHSEITFKIRHLMISNIRGSFKTFDANIYTTDKDFTTAEIDLWIDVASITTGDAKRDEHLKGADFFDVANHKQITFTSSTIGKEEAGGNHVLWGELYIKGIMQDVKLDVQFGGIIKDPWGNERAGFTLSGKVKRSEWGLTWNAALETGGFMMGDEVTIAAEVELTNTGKRELTLELEPAAAKKNSL